MPWGQFPGQLLLNAPPFNVSIELIDMYARWEIVFASGALKLPLPVRCRVGNLVQGAWLEDKGVMGVTISSSNCMVTYGEGGENGLIPLDLTSGHALATHCTVRAANGTTCVVDVSL